MGPRRSPVAVRCCSSCASFSVGYNRCWDEGSTSFVASSLHHNTQNFYIIVERMDVATREEETSKEETWTKERRAVNAKKKLENSARGEWAWGVGKGWQHWSAIVFLRRSHPWFHLSSCQSASTSRFLSFQLVGHWWLIGSWWIILGGGICRWLVGFEDKEV